MHAAYSVALSCPCTRLSMPYSSFMSIQPRFHQVCSSDFIQDEGWLLYFDLVLLPNVVPPGGIFYALDFRQPTGQSLFHLMQTLCQLANETVTNALIVFNDTEFVSAEPLSNDNFDTQTSLLTQQFEQQTLASFLALLSLVRSTIEDNHLYVSSVPNFAQTSFTVNGSWILRYNPKVYTQNGNETCSCLTSNSCTRSQGFYCAQSACHHLYSSPNQTVPGFVMSCFPVNSLLLSTLECLYNQSCVQMLLDWRLFDIGKYYQPFALNISALDSRVPSRFLSTTTMDVIISHLMVEEWTNTTNATAYYDNCEPHVCTYIYTKRYATLYVITTILGLLGGVSIVLRLLIPLAIKFIMQRLLTWRANLVTEQNNTTADDGDPPYNRFRALAARGYQALLSLNLFDTEIENPVLATRIYLLLLSISFSLILLLAGLGQQTHSYTTASPSESAFDMLYTQYGTHGLSCPCSQSSVQYGTFASVSAVYHQVCSSGFISFNWWNLVSATGNTFILKDQPLLGAYFRMLSSLCTLANQTVDNAARVFASNAFVSVETLARSSFESQIESSLNTFIKQTPVTFLRTHKFISDTFRSNQLQHMFMSSWKLVFTTAAENYIEATIPLSYNNNTCTCATSLLSPCSWKLVFVLNSITMITLPGFTGGCLPVDGLRQSTPECLFDPICLATLGTLLNSSMVPSPLNASMVTRFPRMATTFGSMIDQLFVEEWINRTNYSSYYQACSPRICRYTYAEHNDALYMITSLLGFYGGLTVSLRFGVLHGLSALRKIRQWWLKRHRQIIRVAPSYQVD